MRLDQADGLAARTRRAAAKRTRARRLFLEAKRREEPFWNGGEETAAAPLRAGSQPDARQPSQGKGRQARHQAKDGRRFANRNGMLTIMPDAQLRHRFKKERPSA
ncbi:hypothetical protein DY252_21420 [Thalassospira indica]|uniref:Uncharacterized protein n=1 Tax=Thalassospira indica TaxID=1891279 RepID=A0ABM6Y3J3_9PROT|nr:hypothetical protein DY252_21420 [Thalassospira indica]